MDVKYVFKIAVLFCLVNGYFCISVNFCSGETITDYFDAKGSALKLDGSNSAISVSPSKYGPTSCTCVVTPASTPPDNLEVGFVYAARFTHLETCQKSLSVVEHDGHVIHEFRCASDNIEVENDNIKDGVRFTLNLYGNADSTDKVVDDMFVLYVAPDPGAKLSVRCSLPTSRITSSTKTLPDSSSTAAPSTTSTTKRTFVKTGSVDTFIVVGVVVGLGLCFLVFISCLLIFIARRRSRRDIAEKPNLPTKQPQQNRNAVGRTLTNIYDKMKPNRPLPRIPASIRNIARWKTRHNTESGAYDSIKSNNNNAKYTLEKQVSQGSDCSYLEPTAIKTISENVARGTGNGLHPKTDGKSKYVEPINMPAKSVLLLPKKGNLNVQNDSDSIYIHPVPKTESFDDKVDSRDDYENSPPAHTYVNAGEAKLVKNCTDEQHFIPNDPTYMKMCSRADTGIKQDDGDKRISDVKDTNKVLTGEDSTGYLAMNASNISKAKCLAKQKDSTFPELIGYTPHGKDSKDSGVHDLNHKSDTTGTQTSERQNVKNKRYVKVKK